MESICIYYKDVSLKIICKKEYLDLIKSLFANHVNYSSLIEPNYTLYISDDNKVRKGIYCRMVDKWFNNALGDCYIDDANKTCYLNNINADSVINKNLFVQYFVENVFNRLLEINGYIGIHSSCCEKNGNGIMFVGGRNSGKTTSLLNLLNHDFNFITNEKCGLKKEHENIDIYGIPQQVSIRLSKKLRSVEEFKKYENIAKSRNIKMSDESLLDDNRLILTERKLVSLNNVLIVPNAYLRLLIFPVYDDSLVSPKFVKASKEEINQLITSELMPIVHDTKQFLKVIYKDVELNYYEELLKFISNIDAYFCYQNEFTNETVHDKIRKLIL